MKICGIKLTHDGAIALIDNDKLVFSIELEKISNNPRYSAIEDTMIIENVLHQQGYSLAEIDHFVIDGWGGYNPDELAVQPRLQIGEEFNYLSVKNNGRDFQIGVAQYQERNLSGNLLQELQFKGLHINKSTFSYSSYLHVTGHIMSAYCTSPFAANGENSYILIWDGGMFPNLYYLDAGKKKIIPYGPIFLLIGNIYTIFSQHFGPFKVKGNFAKDDLSVAGKVMAYVAKGKCRSELFSVFKSVMDAGFENPVGYANLFAKNFKNRLAEDKKDYSDEDVLRTFHEFMGELIIEKLAKKIKRINNPVNNLCIGGGCALNIKWNSLIRNSKLFQEVYVPPFPNDSGSAIGAACAKRFDITAELNLNWNVYGGPVIEQNNPFDGWKSRLCDIKELAAILYNTNDPVIFLNGKAELGPRALGNRSIIASAGSVTIKHVLNEIKNREYYRPVSPICMEEHAEKLFVPGTYDPFMLYDHQVKKEWIERIPGVIHLDNTARLQTVNKKQNPVMYDLLNEYYLLSGIPLLCNTSANLNGSGFFPDVYSATKWNKTKYVWCDNTLFFK